MLKMKTVVKWVSIPGPWTIVSLFCTTVQRVICGVCKLLCAGNVSITLTSIVPRADRHDQQITPPIAVYLLKGDDSEKLSY